jgi:RNA polymerase sigma-70 factor (ECF subfamily)
VPSTETAALPVRVANRDADEAVLLARLLAGDEEAFGAFVARHQRTMVRVARAFVPCEATAQEVVQDTWLAVLEALPRFQRRAQLKTWVFRILINRARTRGARDRRAVPFSALRGDGEDAGGPAVDPERFGADGCWAVAPRPWLDPERRLLSLEARRALRGALDGLPPRQRLVVSLRDVEGLTSEEVRDLLGLSRENERVLLHRGRSRLRQALDGVLEPA